MFYFVTFKQLLLYYIFQIFNNTICYPPLMPLLIHAPAPFIAYLSTPRYE